MEQTKLSIRKIEIESFKKIRNLTIKPEDGANLLFGSFRSGKTSVCEFIQFALYGADSVALARGGVEDATGRIYFTFGETNFLLERSVIGGVEKLSFLHEESARPVETELTPGEYLTGMDQDSFDLINYFKQARYETPVFKPKFSFLNQIAAFTEGTRDLYRDEMLMKEKALSYRNPEKTGTLDRMLAEKEGLETELSERPHREEEAVACQKALSDIAEKLDENDRRCVLLKADMAGYSDDLKLSENKKDAEELKKSLTAKEKKFRIAQYEVTHKEGLLSEADLAEMKNSYNRLSLAETSLAEARTALTFAEETLSFHKKLFASGQEREHFEEAKKSIRRNEKTRMLFRILGVVLIGLALGLYFILSYLNYELIPCLCVSGALCFLGITAEIFSTIFTASIRRVLSENQKASVSELMDFYDKLCAHEKTTQVYLEEVRLKENEEKRRRAEKESITARIHQKVASLGHRVEAGELLAVCDQIIEANDALYDLKREIETEREQYNSLLTRNVVGESLTVSAEFAALQKELAFLSVQNDSLYKKKALTLARLEELSEQLSRKPEEIENALQEIEKRIEEHRLEADAAELNHSVAKGRKEQFENALKESLAASINQKISFVLGEEESFLFDDQFELCFRDGDSVLPLIKAGGGVVSEMGLLAFRLSLAQLLGKTSLPMIFDDSFAMLSRDASEKLLTVLKESCSQFFIATSSADLLDLCGDGVKVIYL